MRRVGLAIVGAVLLGRAAAQPGLTLRGKEEAPTGAVTAIGLQGATVESAPAAQGRPAATTIYSWDRVAAIGSPEAAVFMPVGEDLWRARMRVARGDYAGAEPLLERHFAAYAGRVGPASALIGDGLMRCRLARGAQTAAVPAMLAYAAAVAEGRGAWAPMPALSEPERDGIAETAWDEGLGLSPALPPMWLNVPSVSALARGEWPAGAGRAAALSGLYQAAAKFETGQTAALPERAGMDDGVALVFDIVAARAGDESQRAAARELISTRLKRPHSAWVDAWCHAALGRSLARESEPAQRLLGVAELLQVPARHERVLPGLTGMCLAEAAVVLWELDEKPAASLLKAELNERFASHPALAWTPLDAVKSGVRTPAAAPTHAPDPAPVSQPAPLTTPGATPPADTGGPP